MIDENDLAYAAGFLDGEGCFTCYNDTKICIACSNTNKPIIEWLRDNFGGSFSIPRQKKKPHHRTIYTWQVVSNEALHLLEMITPYLHQKTEEALLLIAIKHLVYPRGQKAPKEVISERKRLNNLLKELKHVTWN